MSELDTENDENTVNQISNIVGNHYLAKDIHHSIALALNNPFVNIGMCQDVWQTFNNSLDAATMEIETNKKNGIFQRLLQFGPLDLDQPEAPTSDGMTYLSDPECATCVEFIFSHMVNRFQGELGELLALQPCIELIEEMKQSKVFPDDAILLWGNIILERQKIQEGEGNYAKGADGLVVRFDRNSDTPTSIEILAVIEIKSMRRSSKRMLDQITHHINRLSGGIKLGKDGSLLNQVILNPAKVKKIIVRPSGWKLNRNVTLGPTINGVTQLILPEPKKPVSVKDNEKKEMLNETNVWAITLAWSEDALRCAAFEMTYGYMSYIGEQVFREVKQVQNGDSEGEEVDFRNEGYNAIKQALYYMIHRIHYYYSVKEHKIVPIERKAIRLYNIYSFYYVLGADSKYMLWQNESKQNKQNKKQKKDFKPSEMKEKYYYDEKLRKNIMYPWWESIKGD